MTIDTKRLRELLVRFKLAYKAAGRGDHKLAVIGNYGGMALEALPSLLDTIDALEARVEGQSRVEELPMIAFAERLPVRDDLMGEQTILTYNENVGVYDLEFFESGWEFPDKWLGASHWLDITEMWPGVTAQVAEFSKSAFERAEAAERALAEAVEVLGDISNPIRALQREASAEGRKLSGAAYAIANDLHFVQGLARAFLTKRGEK